MRMQFGSRFDLGAKIRRRAQQEPGAAIIAYGNLRLCPRFAVKLSSAQGTTVRTAAIPLRKSSSRCGPQNLYVHGALEFGAGAGIDLSIQGRASLSFRYPGNSSMLTPRAPAGQAEPTRR